MYGWIVDGISSLFQPVTGQNTTGWPADVTREIPTPAAATVEEAQRQESHARPAKRNYQSVHAADIVQNENVGIKRQRRDVVIRFMKKTVAGVAGLLRLRRQTPPTSEKLRPHAEIQTRLLTPMGIDELKASWKSSFDWRMDKPGSGLSERVNGGMNLLQSSSPPLMRKGVSEREDPRRRSLQLPSRPTGTGPPSPDLAYPGPGPYPPSPDLAYPGPGPYRNHRNTLAVEQALKESDRERYRLLVEMVSDKFSKSQPLPFNLTKPQGVTLTQDGHKAGGMGRSCMSTAITSGTQRASASSFQWRDAPSPKQIRDRRGEVWLSKTFTASVDTQPVSGQSQVAEIDLSAEVAARLHLVDRGLAAPTQTHADTHTTHTAAIRQNDKDLPRLTKDMAVEVNRALAQSDQNLVLSSAFKLRITQRDLATLQDSSWLNDEVINFYLSLVMERSSGQGSGVKVYTFSTFFLPKLRGGGASGGHAAVRRWTKAVDIFLYDILLVPLHLGVHWALAVIDFRSRSVTSYDSLGSKHDDICSMLLLYLNEEHRAKKQREMDVSKWCTGSRRASEIPQQKNGSDCGVFACKYADYIAQDRPLTFRQCHMPLFRKLMTWEILNQRLL